MWLIFAFLGPVLWAISIHIDKYLVERYFRNSDTAVLMVFTSMIGIVMLPFIWFFEPSTLAIPLLSILVMVSSGILYMSAMLFYLRAIQSSEASIIAPLFQTLILFTFILGYFILGETISSLNGVGVIFIIMGALVLSLDTSLHFHKFKLRTIFLMLLCTLIIAFSNVIFKYFAIQEKFWVTTFWIAIGEALFGVGILFVPRYFRQFRKLLKENTQSLLAINGANELINLGGNLIPRFASLFVPVVLISAISSTTPLLTFILGVILTIFLPRLAHEDISRRNLLQKGIAAVLVTIGVILAQI